MENLLYHRANNFVFHGDRSKWLKLMVNGNHIGFIAKENWPLLQEFGKDIFVQIDGIPDAVTLNVELNTFEKRSEALQTLMETLRDKDVFPALRGWRNEKYIIYTPFSMNRLCKLERSACALLGVQKFGTHINGYVERDGSLLMWLGVRSMTKATFPGMMDNVVGGGLNSEMTPFECAINECEEEAGLSRDFVIENLRPCGTVSFCYADEMEFHPETEYVFDLKLPVDFKPRNLDGEVASFKLVPVEDLIALVTGPNFKIFSAIVIVDFLIRHSCITPSTPNLDLPYTEMINLIHMRFPFDRS